MLIPESFFLLRMAWTRVDLEMAFEKSPCGRLFTLHTLFSFGAWDAQVEDARVFPPLWPTCWLH